MEEGTVAVSEASVDHAPTTPQLGLLPTTTITSSQLESTAISSTAALHAVTMDDETAAELVRTEVVVGGLQHGASSSSDNLLLAEPIKTSTIMFFFQSVGLH